MVFQGSIGHVQVLVKDVKVRFALPVLAAMGWAAGQRRAALKSVSPDVLADRTSRPHSTWKRTAMQLLAFGIVSLVSQRTLTAQLVQSNGKPYFASPNTNVGSSDTPQNLLLKTTSAETISSFTVSLSMGNKQEYKVGTVTGCKIDGATVIPSGTTCTVPITFSPAYPGPRSVPIQVVTSAGTINFGLIGTGVSPLAAITPGTMTTIAGEAGSQNCAAYSGPALMGTICNPSAGAVDAAGNVYVAAFYSNTVSKIDTSGNITVIAGTGAGGALTGLGQIATSANIERPSDVVVDPAGNVYFGVESAQQILRIDAVTQILTSTAGNGTQGYSGDGGQATLAELNRPEGLAIDAMGNIFIEDQDNNLVRKVDPSGIITTYAGTVASIGESTDAYGGDNGPATSANLELCCGGVYASYDSIGVDGAGNLFIGDSGHSVVREVTTDGIIHTVAGNNAMGAGFSGDGAAATSAQLYYPMGVAVDPGGDVYIADFGNNVIRKVDAVTRVITTIAGNPTGIGAISNDGPATLVYLNGPQKVALDGAGNFYVADTKDNLVREINVSNVTLTFPTPTTVGSTDTTDGPLGSSISDVGNAPLILAPPSSGTNPGISAGFSLVTGGAEACPVLASPSATGMLAPGTTCTLEASFAPVTAGSITGSLVLTDNSLNATSPDATQTITLAGSATAPAVTFSPTSLTFPTTILNATAAAMSSTLTNTGTATLNISGITITGLNPTDFAETNNCGTTLAAGSNCTISVTFTPLATGNLGAQITVADDASGSPQMLSVAGVGGGGVSASPATINFESAPEYIEDYAGVQKITITNNSSATITFGTLVYSNSNFLLYQDDCGSQLLGQSSCYYLVAFFPQGVGSFTGNVSIPYTGTTGSPLTVNFTGTGTAGTPAIDLYRLPVNFGTVQVMTPATSITLQVENVSDVPLTGITASIAGANAGDYTQTNNCSGVTIQPNGISGGSACNITVSFTPSGAGPRNATLTVTSNSGAATFSTPLSGAGVGTLPQIQFTPTQLNLFAGAGSPCSDATTGTAAAATLCNITNAAQDYLGNTYLVDQTYNVVYKVDTTGALSVFAGTPSKTGGYTGDGALATAATLSGPTAVAADAFGNVYISDTVNGAIRLVDTTGTISTFVDGTCDAGGKGTPHNVNPSTTSRLHHHDIDLCETFQPEGLVVDSLGNLIFADTANNQVWSVAIVSAQPNVIAGDDTIAGYDGDNGLAIDAELNAPQDVAVDPAGNVYIADTLNYRIRKVTTATGIITTVAGDGTAGTTGDGAAATSAEINAYGIATDLGGDIFIAAGTGGLVRKVDTTGNITTFAGGGTGAISGPAATGSIANAYFVRADIAGDLLIPTGLQVLAAGPDGLLQFGSESVGSSTTALIATVENTGDSDLSFVADETKLTGTNAADFTITADNCSSSIAPGKTCAISVTFTPTASGARTASVSVGVNAAGSPATILLQGSGTAATAPAASLSPTSITFPGTTAGSTATAMSTTLSNTGTATLNISGITLTGANTADFATTTTCGTTLAAGSTCTISATFTPAAVATYTASISVADNATGSPQTATLTGTGTAAPVPVASLSPTTLTFPATTAGQTATAMSTTLSNTGNAVLNISGITLTGTNSTDFATTTTCGSTLAAGSNCTISATFTPTAAGSFTASISVADNAAGTPQTATLTGTGTAPLATDFALTVTPPTQTVAPGSIAQYTVNTSGIGGDFDSAIQLTATGLPSGFTATFNPSSVTPGATGAGSVLSIQTTSALALAQPQQHRAPWLPASLTALLVVPLLGLRKRIRRLGGVARALSVVLLLAGSIAPVLMLTGCSGGYYSVQTRTYTVTVTGTSGSTQHSTTVTLTVQQ